MNLFDCQKNLFDTEMNPDPFEIKTQMNLNKNIGNTMVNIKKGTSLKIDWSQTIHQTEDY